MSLSLGTSRTLIQARLLWIVQCSINSSVMYNYKSLKYFG